MDFFTRLEAQGGKRKYWKPEPDSQPELELEVNKEPETSWVPFDNTTKKEECWGWNQNCIQLELELEHMEQHRILKAQKKVIKQTNYLVD